MQPNTIYNTHVRLIFYDDPTFGHYQPRFERIFAEPRYTDLTANLRYFGALYRSILASPPKREANAERATFDRLWRDAIARDKADADAALARLDPWPRITRWRSALSHLAIVSSIGEGQAATLAALRDGNSGLRPCDFETVDLSTFTGVVDGIADIRLSNAFAPFDCRNNRLAEMALRQDGFEHAVAAAIARHGARRIGLFLGTSTSGILRAEQAFRDREPAGGPCRPGFITKRTHSVASLVLYLGQRLGLGGRRSSCRAPARPPPRFSPPRNG